MTTTDINELETVVRVAKEATEPHRLDLGSYYVVVTDDSIDHVDLTGDEHRDHPKRMTGTTTVRDVASLATLWRKYAVDSISEIYADRDRLAITVVFDAHDPDSETPGWRQHRAILALQHTSAWAAWTGASGREMDQETFANFLEDNRADIRVPAAADMLEVAQSIQAVTKVDFAAGHRLVDGQRRIAYTETIDSRAGAKGELAIPAEIVLGLPVFKGATFAEPVTARFRHRLNGGSLRLMFKLDRPDDVVDAAFAAVIAEVAQECAATVLVGTPA